MLTVDAHILRRAHDVYSRILAFHVLTLERRYSDATAALGLAIGSAAHGMREITDLPTQAQPAEGVDLPKRPMRVVCAIGVAQPHPHAVNDHHATPTNPEPSIA